MTIQWFPGHMAKTRKLIQENLKGIDVVVEILDGRIPLSSKNPLIDDLIKGKERLVILNKSDLADEIKTKEWIEYFDSQEGTKAIQINSLKDAKNIKKLIKDNIEIDMVIELEDWQEGKYYDRLGIDNDLMKIMEVSIPKVTIPVMPGRNLAIIIETAARNHREKLMGYNAAQTFVDRVYKITSKNTESKED